MSELKETILIVEDDVQIRNFIVYALKNEGFNPKIAIDARSGLNTILTEQIDLVLLDLGLPDFDGKEVIEKVRSWSEIPIIVVSARDQEKEKAQVLDMGADDYLTKPFSAMELLARIRVALRHSYKRAISKLETVYHVKGLKLDIEKRIVTLNNEILHLTPLEYTLLSLLFKYQGKVITTSTILKEIYGVNYGNDTQALRALMAGLRRKIEINPAKPEYIMTEIGVGYRLVEE